MTPTATASIEAVRAHARRIVAEYTDPDPHDLGAVLLAEVGDDEKNALLRFAAADVLREAIRMERARTRTPRPGRSWKESVTPHDLLAQSFCVDGVWKRLGDCTRQDCQWLATAYRQREAQNRAHAEEFEDYDARMQAEGVDRVSELAEFTT